MLIRFTLENTYSFGDQKEFNMIPYTGHRTLKEHCYKVHPNLQLLKMASIYGANGAGKSNLIKGIVDLRQIVLRKNIPLRLKEGSFKFHTKERSQILVTEFIEEEIPFYYGIELFQNQIITEELYLSGLGKKEDQLLFERKTSVEGKSDLLFSEAFEQDAKSQILKSILLEEFVKPSESVFSIIAKRENAFLSDVRKAFNWFESTLQIITPNSKPTALAQDIDTDFQLKEYAQQLMRSFNIGITSLSSEKKPLLEYFGEDNTPDIDRLREMLEQSDNNLLVIRPQRGEELVIVEEKGELLVKTLKVGHSGISKSNVLFDLSEESDGTIRLLDFVPAFNHLISSPKVFIIDEIERSIHPLLIKELIRKFSSDTQTKGQLIFTTHESNLLDQSIFRQDEIWFAEKDQNGSTDLYSLSEFKEHKTIDIRKGYLNGRYGSIPFLGNLRDLNWNEYVVA